MLLSFAVVAAVCCCCLMLLLLFAVVKVPITKYLALNLLLLFSQVILEMEKQIKTVAGISRVLYDLTAKPPGTTEWE